MLYLTSQYFKIAGPALSSNISPSSVAKSENADDMVVDDDVDVPEETESVLEELFNALEDKVINLFI